MDSFYHGWFTGWMQGMAELSCRERTKVFRQCGKACAQPEMLPRYQRLLQAAADADGFFDAVNREVDGVDVQTVTRGSEYDLYYPQCYCPLHVEGGVNDGMLCECSRESLLWLMGELFPERKPTVELLASVLRGDARCCLRVRLH